MVKDLTEGKPLRLLFMFSLPMIAGNLFQQLYNMVDSMVVGKFVGEDALAAVGSSFPVVFLAVAIAAGLSMGGTVVISQLFGAKRICEMKTTIWTALISLGVLGLIVSGVGEVIAGPLLRLLGTDPDIYEASLVYLRIYFGSALFLFLYNSLNGIFNALGDSRTPLYFLILSALTNIALDLLFVIHFEMGVAGVAWATLISQVICAVLSLGVMLRRVRAMPNEENADGEVHAFEKQALGRIVRIGVPSMLQQSLVSLSMLFMQNLVNSFQKVYVAGYTAASKIDSLAMMFNLNLSNAMSSYTAQNIGAGKIERVKQGYRATMLLVVIGGLLITGAMFLFGDQLIGLFLPAGESSGALGYGLDYMHIVSLFYIVMGFLFVGNGTLRGAGDMTAFMLNSGANLTVRIVVAYVLVYAVGMGETAIAWSVPIGWGFGAIITYLRFRSGKWMTKKSI